ncbi:hypothetical protein JOD43_003111 [Pullulanibacillus pueri]|uniref:HTH arsR-type domain-containing protein n=1 Tax=Pullulanibacillus pueri TaxID=1437324 RepID=A0A8J3ENJ8_9BACL|nr:DUF2087 domain-containing protein [Pullulanibacillus pueri]MBM7682932.1 hypothetical protein [Pullulanibacillus pueri]GGH84749.1 hypothetical protein GCM10007096_28550 [Pullulanibacillus pueri]
MQLEKLVHFHKIMGDPTRIKILALLSHGPLHGQAIAGKLGKTAPTITHHMTKLREINAIRERREKNTIYFELNLDSLRGQTTALLTLIQGKEREMESMTLTAEKLAVVRNFLDKEGRLKNIPAQKKKKLMVLEYLVQGLELGKRYPERELNEYLKQYHEDFATLRREFIMHQFMYRENGIYELNPPEMWDNKPVPSSH